MSKRSSPAPNSPAAKRRAGSDESFAELVTKAALHASAAAITCSCGQVSIAPAGLPDACAFCHCRTCRLIFKGFVNAIAIYQSVDFNGKCVVRKHTNCESYYCEECFDVCGFKNARGGVNVPLVLALNARGNIRDAHLHPTYHIHYRDRGYDLMDTHNLTIYLGLPTLLGGSNDKYEPELQIY